MEKNLQYMKTLPYQMNDVEDQAAKISVEEQQMQTIQTLEKDLDVDVEEDVEDQAAEISFEEQMQTFQTLKKDLDLGMASQGTSQNYAIAERFDKKTPVIKPKSVATNYVERKKSKDADLQRAKARDKKMKRMQP